VIRFFAHMVFVWGIIDLFFLAYCANSLMTGWAEQCSGTSLLDRCWILKANVDLRCQLLWFPKKWWLKSENSLLLQVHHNLLTTFYGCMWFRKMNLSYLSRQNGESYVGLLDHNSGSFSKLDLPFSSVTNIVSTQSDDLPQKLIDSTLHSLNLLNGDL
jgi:hypothetical protein